MIGRAADHRFLRRLPRTVSPYPNEVLDFYLTRIDRANGLTPATLAQVITTSGLTRRAAVNALTGLSDRTLTFALPELRTPADNASYPALQGYPVTVGRSRSCPRCAARRGCDQAVPIWSTHEQVLCWRHRIWTGSPALFSCDQAHIAAIPEVLDANRVHRKLIATSGREPVRTAFIAADIIIDRWAEQRLIPAYHERLRRLLGRDVHRVAPGARTNAARYPEVVTLTAMLVDEHWAALITSGDSSHWEQVTRRIAGTITGRYRPTGTYDPLVQWAETGHAQPSGPPETI